MSNPCINRWGINTFWYNFWYSDTKYASNLKQDAIFTRLLNIYLFHGLNIPMNIFANTYWYAKNFKKLNLPSYFRWFTMRNNITGLKANYLLRQTTDCIFPMRIWILKYSNWIVINLYWFKPFKKKPHQKLVFDRTTTDYFSVSLSKNLTLLRKVKTLTSLNYLHYAIKNSYYKF